MVRPTLKCALFGDFHTLGTQTQNWASISIHCSTNRRRWHFPMVDRSAFPQIRSSSIVVHDAANGVDGVLRNDAWDVHKVDSMRTHKFSGMLSVSSSGNMMLVTTRLNCFSDNSASLIANVTQAPNFPR